MDASAKTTMNLKNYPTPRTDEAKRDGYTFNREDPQPAIELCGQLEREATTWEEIANYALNCLNQAAKDEGKPMSLRLASTSGLSRLAHELRDALKSELQP